MIKKAYLFLVIVFGVTSCATIPEVRELLVMESKKHSVTISDNWMFRQVGAEGWLPATVPGTVHTDLLDNQLIMSPYYSLNEEQLQWIENEDWEYRVMIHPTSEFLGYESQILHLKGLDVYAEIYLNGEHLLSTDNMFREWQVDVKGKLKDGSNELLIRFLSTQRIGLELAEELPIKLPADNDKSPEAKTSPFVRKAQYHFGWDWAPRYVTMGIWRDVYLVGYDNVSIEDVHYIQKSQSETEARLDAHVRINALKDSRFTILVVDSTGYKYVEEVLDIKKGGSFDFKFEFEIQNPVLWQPNGLGAPHLYPLSVILVKKDQKYDQWDTNVGIRTVELVQEADEDGVGESFYFKVNGQRVFAKGANHIPLDMFVTRVSPERYEEIISSARESNMNMIRVWGGGIYESDVFYDLCDRNGIMVWQDFMFSCAFYPWDDDFLANVRQEAVDNVRRLRNHPSLVMWCGNNEIEEAWHHWGYQSAYEWSDSERREIYSGMQKLFDEVIPSVLAKEDTTRFYLKSSPMYGRGNRLSRIKGDMHYWGVFHDEEPFSAYRDNPGRFSSEYGFQSFSCYDTYREYYSEADLRLYSDALLKQQKNPKGYRLIEQYMDRDLPLLKGDFRQYIYLSQLLQAEGMKVAIEAHRQNRPFTEGTLYWQLGDAWPALSWSSIDYTGRWKALQFYVRECFEPVRLSFWQSDSISTIKLFALNDWTKDVSASAVTVSLMKFDGEVLWRNQKDTLFVKNSNTLIFEFDYDKLLKEHKVKAEELFFVARAEVEGKAVRTLHYLVPLKDLNLPKADYEVNYSQEEDYVRVVIRANNLLKNVLFEAEAIQHTPSDGFFDMLPGEEREVILRFKEDRPIDDLGIFITTLNDLIGKPRSKPTKENIKS